VNAQRENAAGDPTRNPRVLVVAPGHKGRGGIDAVVRLHQSTDVWNAMGCTMLATYDDRSAARKAWAAASAYAMAPAALLRADVVHMHLAGEISLLRKVPVMAMARAMRRLVIVHIHACSEESLFVKTPRWAWRYMLHAAERVIALSPMWADAIRRHAPGVEVEVVPNPVRLFAARAPQHSDAPRILYVGKLEARKGYDTLLAAAPIVLKEFPRAEFCFAGHGEVEAAQTQAKALGIASSVRLLGWTSGKELERVYEETDVFCLPSHNEGVPMAMLEAMSHAVPVVCTPVGGVPDVIVDGSNGLFVTPGSADSVADGILRLLRNRDVAEAMGRLGQKTVQATCGLDAVAAQMAAIYREVAAPVAGELIGADRVV
jgi:glycosyltransferase involved in cell wall biosynthesis